MGILTTLFTHMHFGKQPYKVVHVTTVPQLLEHWGFIRAGWQELALANKARTGLTESECLTMMLRVLTLGPDDGLLVIFTSQNDKPLGYMAVMNDSETPERRTALIYLGYSTGKYLNAPVVATEYVEQWAKDRGFSELHAQSRRLSGAAMRLFRKKLGFEPMAVVFSKKL